MLGLYSISGKPLSGSPNPISVVLPIFSTNITGSYSDRGSFNYDDLTSVRFGDVDGLGVFLFENGRQHQVFYEQLSAKNILITKYPLYDADPSNLDDWLFVHNDEHQRIASELNLPNPFSLLDSDWNVEDDFYNWMSIHVTMHQQIEEALTVVN